MANKKISDLISSLEIIMKKHGDLDLIYSQDDEGNSYNLVYHSPTPGHYYYKDRDWVDEQSLDDDMIINSVCIN